MTGQRILIIEDEKDIVELIRFNLAREGYQVDYALSGEKGLEQARTQPPDLIILDLMLPELGGLDVCKALKSSARTRNVPVIMLTAKSEESDIVTGLEVGADDYMTKPFSPSVLLARVRAVIRRKSDASGDEVNYIKAGEITIDLGRHEVRAGDTSIDLTPTEFLILRSLARRPGWVFSRTQIVDEVRGGESIITDRAVDVQIVGLRKKLGDYGDYIETVRGVGYKFRES